MPAHTYGSGHSSASLRVYSHAAQSNLSLYMYGATSYLSNLHCIVTEMYEGQQVPSPFSISYLLAFIVAFSFVENVASSALFFLYPKSVCLLLL